MSRLAATSSRLAAALLLAAAATSGACKEAASGVAGDGGQMNALYGGGSGGASGAQRRTDQPPTLSYVEDVSARAERIFESRLPSGELLRFREVVQADGQGRLRADVLEVWDAATQSWIPPHPLLEGLYAQRTSFVLRLRDLHLHARGRLANYRWEPLAGTVDVDGRTCAVTRAHSLHGLGPIDLVHELGTGLLLGWTVWDVSGTQMLRRLTTTDLELQPNQNGVIWVDDRLPEEAYDANVHDAELGFTPRPLDYAPIGFYREKAVVMDLRAFPSPVQYVHLEYWSDGLRMLYVMQHAAVVGNGATGGISFARMSREGGVIAIESDATDRRIAAVGLLPMDDVLMVVGALHE
jgi:hypothetical protein